MDLSSEDGRFDRVIRLIRELRRLNITTYAGYASFFIVLSVFPTLALLLGMLRHTALEPSDLMDLLDGFLPEALQSYGRSLILRCYENTGRLPLSVSALTALWSAGKGIYGLMKGLNAVYGVQEHRPWLRTRLLCAVYMVCFLAVLMLTLVLNVFGNTLLEFLRLRGMPSYAAMPGVRYVLSVTVQTALFAAVYMQLPDRSNGFRESLPGALFASCGWMTVSGLFGVYMERGGGYTGIFGPGYTLAMGMLWLYVCVNTLFFGGVLNRYLKDPGENMEFS